MRAQEDNPSSNWTRPSGPESLAYSGRTRRFDRIMPGVVGSVKDQERRVARQNSCTDFRGEPVRGSQYDSRHLIAGILLPLP